MVDQDINKEAQKIEGLAEKSLQGDKDAANELSREVTELMKKDPEYLKKLQSKIDADEKANQSLPNIELEGPARVILEERKSENYKWDASGNKVPVLDKQIYHSDGTVAVTPTDALAPAGSDKKYYDWDRVKLQDVGNFDHLDVRKDASGRPTTIVRYDSRIDIERDKAGNPTKIDGIDGQTWTKDEKGNTWSVKDKDGNVVETRTDVVVKSDGTIESKGSVRMGHDPADTNAKPGSLPYTEVLDPVGVRERTYTNADGSQTVVADGPRTVTYRGLDKNPYNPERDQNGNPIMDVSNPVHYTMEKDANGRVTSIERGAPANMPESVKIEYGKDGNPNKIAGLEAQTMEKNDNGTWTVKDAQGKVVEYRADVVVKPNGDIEYKQIDPLVEQGKDFAKDPEPAYIEPAEIKTVHLDGSTSARKQAAAAPTGQRRQAKPNSDPTFTSGQCLPGDPLCSTL